FENRCSRHQSRCRQVPHSVSAGCRGTAPRWFTNRSLSFRPATPAYAKRFEGPLRRLRPAMSVPYEVGHSCLHAAKCRSTKKHRRPSSRLRIFPTRDDSCHMDESTMNLATKPELGSSTTKTGHI